MTRIFGVEGFPPPTSISIDHQGEVDIYWIARDKHLVLSSRTTEYGTDYSTVKVYRHNKLLLEYDYKDGEQNAAQQALEILKEWGMA